MIRLMAALERHSRFGFWAALALGLALLAPIASRAETITFEGSWGNAGFNLSQQDAGGVEIIFSVPSMYLEDVDINGEMMKNISFPGAFMPNNAGAPNLPSLGRFIALPQGAKAELEVVDFRTEIFHNQNLAPAFVIQSENDDSPLQYFKDPTIYTANANYPSNPVMLGRQTDIRGVEAVVLGVTPFQYNPVTKDLIVYKDIRVKVNFIGGSRHFGEDRLRSPWWDPILDQNLLNYAALPNINYAARKASVTDETNVEYLIIVPDDPVFIAWADTLKRWRNEQGIKTGITTLTEIGGNDYTLIKNYILNAYQSWQIPPVAVLLLSDYQTSGVDLYGITSTPFMDGGSYSAVSDNFYVDANNDNLPDMEISRIPAQNAQQLQTIINKMLLYERQPITNANYYARPLIAGGWQTERWFIMCDEVIYGYLHNVQGKTPTRQYAIYSGTPGSVWSSTNPSGPVTYFGPSPGLGYIPANPSYLTDWSGNATGINAAINAGAFMVMHRDHGMETGWGEPSYTNTNVNQLTNAMTTFVFTINCLTGKFQWNNTCFAEAFLRSQYGAMGVLAPTETSWSFVNDIFAWGMMDCMWPNFDPGYGNPNAQWNQRPGFADASGKYYLAANSFPIVNPNNKVDTYRLFHHLGDAFMTLNSEVPQNLAVTHLPTLFAGQTQFAVTANAGSWIGLSVDGLVIGAGLGTGAPVNLTIPVQTPGHTLRVTVTKANYFRYLAEVPVVAAQGPYVVHNRSIVNDAVVGNNNGQWDFGETTNLNTELKNLGVDPAPDVNATISETDPLVTVLDNSQAYGAINPGDSIMINNAFQIQAAANTPDQQLVTFTVTATSGTNTWVSSFPLVINAPVIAKDTVRIQDPGGNNNGQLDPGENTTFVLTMANDGHSAAQNVSVGMTCDNVQVTIAGSPVNFGTMNPGGVANGNYNVIAAAGIPSGTLVTFTLNVTAAGGYTHTETFDLVCGDVRNMPSGPDAYGYKAWDNLDGGEAHAYSWTEVAPQHGGPGTLLNWSTPDDAVQTVTLPFSFRYYGANFTQLSICTNGWVAMGSTTINDYTNTGIPNADGPPNMVGVYWRDMYVGTGAQVATYHNTTQHLFVVEWDSVYHYNTSTQRSTFEVILYDPAYYPTSSGDGVILIQYKLVYANDTETFGVENQAQTVGIQYGFNGAFDTHAWPVQAGRTITYTTNVSGGIPPMDITLTPIHPPIEIPANGGSFQYTIQMANTGATPITFSAWIMQYTPGLVWQGPMLGPISLTVPGGVTVTRHRTQNVPRSAAPGTYTYRGYVGVYPGTKWDSSGFNYTKSTTGEGPWMENWDNYGDSFAPYLTPVVASDLPQVFSLAQCHPNPFNPTTTINYGLPNGSWVNLKVYDLQGRLVAELVDGMKEAGIHQATFDGSRLASGMYFYRLQAGDFSAVRKMILVK